MSGTVVGAWDISVKKKSFSLLGAYINILVIQTHLGQTCLLLGNRYFASSLDRNKLNDFHVIVL